jgi:protein tyrosine/serine phosphatase
VALAKLHGLLQAGIRVIINLMEEHETSWDGAPFVPYQGIFQDLASASGIEVEMMRFPIQDLTCPSRAAMCMILDTIDSAIYSGRPVFVHCWAGRGRTGTVVGCYLARHGLASGIVALNKIQELRRFDPTAHLESPQTGEQRSMVIEWSLGI